MNTKTVTLVRRAVGIAALLFWPMAILPLLLIPNTERLVWQLDNWALIFAPALTLVYAVLLTVRLAKGKHWTVKVGEWLACMVVALLCLVTLFFALVMHAPKVADSDSYVIYNEYGGLFDPNVYTVYRRDGLLNHRETCLEPCELTSYITDVAPTNEVLTIYDSLGLILHEGDVMFQGTPAHKSIFFDLHSGSRYDSSQNDSLFALVYKTQETSRR